MNDSKPDGTNNAPAKHRKLIGAVIVAAVIAVFFIAENHRGHKSWRQVCLELAHKGERLDLAFFITPEGPREENFVRTPFLQNFGFNKSDNRAAWKVDGDFIGSLVPHIGDWRAGKSMDFAAMKKLIIAQEANQNEPGKSAALDVLSAFQIYEPELSELRTASLRPRSVYPMDTNDFYHGAIPNFVLIRTLAQILTVHAVASLAENRMGNVETDLRIMSKFTDGLETSPMLVSAMIRVALEGGLYMQVYWEGLRQGRWTDENLAFFQNKFIQINLVSNVVWAVRGGERAGLIASMEIASRDGKLGDFFSQGQSRPGLNAILQCLPEGWRYQNQALCCRLLQSMLDSYDREQNQVFPQKIEAALKAFNAATAKRSPYNYLAWIALPNLLKALQTAAYSQNFIQMAALTCALERHKRATGAYPESLMDLSPKWIDRIPKDILTGDSFRYRRTENGRFTLYSLGWNLKDDGGKSDESRELGDWVWPGSGGS